MSNYGALAILALTMKRRRKVPSPDEADLRWLIVLETFPADTDGWRRAGAQLLADEAGLAYSTSRAARDRLVAAGVIEYRPGTGRGKRSAYRFATPLKVPTMGRHLAETGEDDPDKPDKGADPSSAPFPDKGADPSSAPSSTGKGAEAPPGKVPRHAEKGAEHNPLASGNANPALEAFALGTSAPLSPRANALHELLAAEVPDVTERETQLVLEEIASRKDVRRPNAVMRREIKDGLGPALVANVRQKGDPAVRSWSGAPAASGGEKFTPSPPPYCADCGTAHYPGACATFVPDPDPEPQARPAPTAAEAPETPCAAGKQCVQRHTSLDDGQEHHEACLALVPLRAAARRPKGTGPDGAQRFAAKQVDESRAVRSSQDGGHAA